MAPSRSRVGADADLNRRRVGAESEPTRRRVGADVDLAKLQLVDAGWRLGQGVGAEVVSRTKALLTSP